LTGGWLHLCANQPDVQLTSQTDCSSQRLQRSLRQPSVSFRLRQQ
jgi:hypothetical protein